MRHVLKNWRIVMFSVTVFISLLLLTNIVGINPDNGFGFGNGLDYGIDFAGGIQMQLRLERPVSTEVMSVEKQIIENRLNSMGLKDIPVRPWGDQYLLVTIAQATPDEERRIEEVLRQQARFEERIDGQLATLGDEVSVDLGPQGARLAPVQGGYSWSVSVSHNKEGACRFGKAGDGKLGRPVDIFIDRPGNATIIFPTGEYLILANMTDAGDSDRFYFGQTMLEVIGDRAHVEVMPLSSTTQSSEEFDIKAVKTAEAILAGDENQIPDSVRNRLEEEGIETVRIPQGNMSYIDWVKKMLGLQSALRLAFDPGGECVYHAVIEGSSGTLEEAQAEIRMNQVLLTSGNLPVALTIESKSTTPPTLGHKFLVYSLYTGIIAILAVGLIIFIRYKRIEILLPVMAASIGDIVMILGFAALISWELDLPALAGIIAAVGTGVDHLIVITDETLKMSSMKKRISMSERIRKAFFIIFTAAATIFAAMAPLMVIGAGMLKGFAFTTLMGVLIGVSISRPAYAKIIEELLKKGE